METDFKIKFTAAIHHFENQISTLRSGRATPSLIEQLLIDCYGSRLPLVQIASVSAPEPRQLIVQPWDVSVIKDIERAIQASPLGLQPIIEGGKIRINLPQLTEERRKELLRVLHQYEEAAKVAIKRSREEIIKTWRDQSRSGLLPEDSLVRQEKEIQAAVDDYHQELRRLTTEKEQEILTV